MKDYYYNDHCAECSITGNNYIYNPDLDEWNLYCNQCPFNEYNYDEDWE